MEVAPAATTVEAVSQAIYPVAEAQKTDLLVRLLEEEKLDRVLVFTRTKHRADRVCRHLERSRIKGAAIHSNRSQSQRQHALDGFKNGTYRVLVATDIVARGIDVDRISHVINYDLPAQAQDYVHRIGRTARAGASGTAISFLAAEQAGELREIEVMLGEPSALPGPGRLRLHGAVDPESGADGQEGQAAPGLQRERAPEAVARRTAPRRRKARLRGQPPDGLPVFLAGLLDHLVGQLRGRRLLVPLDGFQVVAHVLLVEARLRPGPARTTRPARSGRSPA